MPVPIIMPKFGFTLESCQLLDWLVNVGDSVREGDPIAEVETDKVNMEVEATHDGTIIALLPEVGTDVPVTDVIAYLQLPDENLPDDWQPPAQPEKPALSGTPEAPTPEPQPDSNGSRAEATPVARRMASKHAVDLGTVSGTGPRGKITKQDVAAVIQAPAPAPSGNGGTALAGGKVAATPAARRLAREHDVDLITVTGTGPGGRVQGTDVLTFVERGPVVQAPAAAPMPSAHPVPTVQAAPPDADAVPLRGMRKRIADRLQRSFQEAPHIFFDVTVDMTAIVALRERFKAQDKKVSVTSILVKACAHVLMDHPQLNATFDGQTIYRYNSANIGVAVALDNGLVVPVVHKADQLSLGAIQHSVVDLAGRARDGKITPDEFQGGTFTVSNLGMYGVDRFTAIINPPQVGILAVGRTIEQFVPDENGNPVLHPVMNITVSADHRVVDGAQVAQFIHDLRVVLEEPALLMW